MAAASERFKLKRELDFGDILTSMSILVSVLGLGLTWLHDQSLKTQTYADEIRKSAAAVTGKLERWTQLSDLYFENLMPSLEVASEEAAKAWSRQPANGDMYSALQKARFESSNRIAQEQLELSYMELYRYVPELQPRFDETIKDIRKAEDDSHISLEGLLQDALYRDLNDPAVRRRTLSDREIFIGNDLRVISTEEETRVHDEIEKTTRHLRDQMLCLINLPDGRIQDPAKRRTAIASILGMTAAECPTTNK